MEKSLEIRKRVLARRMATELSPAQLARVAGQGTSWGGTGGCDSQGRGVDVQPIDCVEGGDTYKCK
jgi:hypothetical protein